MKRNVIYALGWFIWGLIFVILYCIMKIILYLPYKAEKYLDEKEVIKLSFFLTYIIDITWLIIHVIFYIPNKFTDWLDRYTDHIAIKLRKSQLM